MGCISDGLDILKIKGISLQSNKVSNSAYTRQDMCRFTIFFVILREIEYTI